MSPKLRPWQLIVLIAVLCAAAVGGVVWHRAGALTTAALLKRLPTEDALVVYVDFSALRRAGILQLLDGSKTGEDPDYQTFVRRANLDYQRDLDTALVAFAPTGKFMLLRGRFDWDSLRAYVAAEHGRCEGSLCRVVGSAAERRISFFPLQAGLMALAVSPDASAALRLRTPVPATDLELPDAPIWLSIPGAVLRGESLPTGTRPFARSMERARSVTLSFVPEGNRLAARLNVRCVDERDAVQVASQLSDTTNLLRSLIEREHQKPNPADLSGVLTAGAFRSEGRRVIGYWPIERVFVENLLGR
ncbi:MAG: hypothetical protein LAP87_29670 [Acidobacteriia bacterium]|nr:hypothetical protein [Terriglobia bacterium]